MPAGRSALPDAPGWLVTTVAGLSETKSGASLTVNPPDFALLNPGYARCSPLEATVLSSSLLPQPPGGHHDAVTFRRRWRRAIIAALLGSPSDADVISDWSTAVAPPAPELKEVTVEPSTRALLLLDIMKAGCSARPRCVAAMPNIKRMHDEARAHNMVVWYSLVGERQGDAR